MATIQARKNKEGVITAYQIRVFRGRDVNGKPLKPYSTTWKVPASYKTEKAIQKALQKAVGEFETLCGRGEISAEKRSLSEYMKYFIELSQRDSKVKSIDHYTSLLPRIDTELGHLKLANITVEHLNKFYLKLQTADVRLDKKAVAKDALLEIKKERGITHAKLQDMSGLAENTIREACNKRNIAPRTAEKIAIALGEDIKVLFDISSVSGKIGLSPKTINHYHTFIHSVLNQAKREGLVRDNIADMASPPKSRKKDAEFFEIDEIIAIRNALTGEPSKYRLMIFLLTDTGIRRGELFGLRWNAIDFENNIIKIDNNIQWSKTKGLYADSTKNDKVRYVSIADEIRKVLKSYRAEQNELKLAMGGAEFNKEGYLFIQEHGNVMHPSSLNHWIRGFAKRHNLPHIYPHKFRHSQASLLYASGIDPVTISHRLGHQQVSTTQNIYAHLMSGSDKKASDAIADMLYRTTK